MPKYSDTHDGGADLDTMSLADLIGDWYHLWQKKEEKTKNKKQKKDMNSMSTLRYLIIK